MASIGRYTRDFLHKHGRSGGRRVWDFTLSNEDAASGRQYREVVQLIGVDKGMPGEDGVDDVIAQISDGQVGHFDGIHYTYRHSCQHKFPATQLDEDQNPLFIRIDEIQVRVTLSSESDSNIVRQQDDTRGDLVSARRPTLLDWRKTDSAKCRHYAGSSRDCDHERMARKREQD